MPLYVSFIDQEIMEMEVIKQTKRSVESTTAVDSSTFLDVSSMDLSTSDVSKLESSEPFQSELINMGRVPSKNLSCFSLQKNGFGETQKETSIIKITAAKHRRNRRYKLKQRLSELPMSQLVELIAISHIDDDF